MMSRLFMFGIPKFEDAEQFITPGNVEMAAELYSSFAQGNDNPNTAMEAFFAREMKVANKEIETMNQRLQKAGVSKAQVDLPTVTQGSNGTFRVDTMTQYRCTIEMVAQLEHWVFDLLKPWVDQMIVYCEAYAEWHRPFEQLRTQIAEIGGMLELCFPCVAVTLPEDVRSLDFIKRELVANKRNFTMVKEHLEAIKQQF